MTLGLLGYVTAASADRAPSPEELARITSALQAQGFTRWGEIELDDSGWEVDDAYAQDGRKYELKLHPQTLEIIKREADD
jgi:hypothetical protein